MREKKEGCGCTTLSPTRETLSMLTSGTIWREIAMVWVSNQAMITLD